MFSVNSDIAFFIAPSASFAKHAVEKLSSLDRYGAASSRLPTLVFSSDNVLDRQSMVNGRSGSIDLASNSGSGDDDDGDELNEEAVVGSLETALDAEMLESQDHMYGPSGTTSTFLIQGRGRINSTESSSSAASSASSSTSILGSQLPMLPPFARNQQQPQPQRRQTPLLRRTSSVLDTKHLRRLQDHIIICGPFAHGHQIACYIEELYKKERVDSAGRVHLPTVLLLVKRFPRDADFENLPRPLPANVYVERGVSQNVEDLLRVRAFEAKAVLMIPGHWKYHVDEFREESLEELSDHLIDYQVIMSTLSLQTMHDLHHEHLLSSGSQQQFKQRGGLHDIGERAGGNPQKLTLGCSVVRSHDSIKYFAYKSSQSNHGHGLHRVSSAQLFRRKRSSRFFLSRSKAAKMDDLSGREAEMLLPAAFAPSYAAGEVFVDSVLDTLLCQSFFNPYVIDLVHALAGDYYSSGHHHAVSSERTFASSMMKYFEARVVPPVMNGLQSSSSGSVQTNAHTANRAAALDRHPSISQAGSLQGNSSTSVEYESDDEDDDHVAGLQQEPMDDFRHPVLSTATVARELEGASFLSIFARGLEQGVLVLGIYRRAHDPRRGNTLPYVFTCPDVDAEPTVERGDCLHVITKHHPPVCIQ